MAEKRGLRNRGGEKKEERQQQTEVKSWEIESESIMQQITGETKLFFFFPQAHLHAAPNFCVYVNWKCFLSSYLEGIKNIHTNMDHTLLKPTAMHIQY